MARPRRRAWWITAGLVVACRAPASAPAPATTAASTSMPPAVVAPEPPTEPSTPDEPERSLEVLLERHAVVGDDFVRLELYTWTTPAQIHALRAGGPLYVADARAGGRPTPYRLLLAAMVAERRPGHALAALLRDTPALSRCRYAWPSPLATVLGLGSQRYGEALVRIRLRPEAVIARLDPTADPPWTLRDGEGHPVELDELLEEPTRIGAVYHLRVDETVGTKFREYVLCSPTMVEAWEVGTPAIGERVAEERRLVLDLARGPFAGPRAGHARWPAFPQWLDASVPVAWASRWHRVLAFDNARYRPTPANLEALAEALADYDPTPPPLVWPAAPDSKSAHTAR